MAKWSLVQDSFPGSALGANWYGSYGTFTVAGGQVDIDNVGYAGIITFGNDLSDSSLFVKMAAGGATGGHAYLGLRNTADTQIAALFARA